MVKAKTNQKRQKKPNNELRNERRRKQRYENKFKSTKPPRPPNRFILYRKAKQAEYVDNPKLLNQRLRNSDPNNPIGMRELSTIISEDWANEPSHVKEEWDRIAEQIKLMPPYSKNLDVINELQVSLYTNESGTFVNLTPANSRQSRQKPTKISENFIFESPCHTPSEPESPIQTSEDEIYPTFDLSRLSVDEPPLDEPFEFVDPRLAFTGGDDGTFFTRGPDYTLETESDVNLLPIFMWETVDSSFEIENSPLGIDESLFETAESPFLTPTEDIDDIFWNINNQT